MGVQMIGKYGVALDSFAQVVIDRLLLWGLGMIVLLAVAVLMFKGIALLLWDEFIIRK